MLRFSSWFSVDTAANESTILFLAGLTVAYYVHLNISSRVYLKPSIIAEIAIFPIHFVGHKCESQRGGTVKSGIPRKWKFRN